MNEIASVDQRPIAGDPAPHPVLRRWLASAQGWFAQISAFMQLRQAHAARTVVLLPYAQLMPVAARLWAQAHPQGFAPRFETTINWSRSLAGFVPSASDIAFDVAQDVLTARALIARAGLGQHSDALATSLMEAAQQLAALAGAVPPAQRAAWAVRARAAAQIGMEGPALALESALAQMAVAWAAHSSYATDVLFEARAREAIDCLVVLQGLQADPLIASLQAIWGDALLLMELDDPAKQSAALTQIIFHQARDAQDEAQLAAACVLQHLNAGRIPVALVATDRALTRRVRAMLEGSGLSLRDENGWKLSTSRSAAHVMGALRACAWNASSDSVLDWLKNSPAFDAGALRLLEAGLRRDGVREWRKGPNTKAGDDPALTALLAQVQTLRDSFKRERSLPDWLAALRALLQHSGQWALLQDDAAGEKLLAALRLGEDSTAHWQALLSEAPWAAQRLNLAGFTQWVNQALEGESFTSAYPDSEQVVILPMSQMLGRPFAAVVMPGCDEVRLNPSPEPPGLWSAAQRLALGLPAREALAADLRAAWQQALQTPMVDLLWRQSDEGGEPLLPSPLLQALRLQMGSAMAVEPRLLREVQATPLSCPAPVAPQLGIQRLSASAYEDLRRCPYRFFALRQLGLKEAEELESELGKRDFGLWLHAVLKGFHDQLKVSGAQDADKRLALINAAADEVTYSMRLAEDEFLPFMAAWPQVREGYLDWLVKHEADGARFEKAEIELAQPLGPLTLIGRIDRMDQVAASGDAPAGVMVIDYKTESSDVTAKRIKSFFEDTQLAFYAALLPHDTLRAAYVNVGESGTTRTYEQKDVVVVRDALIEGIVHDMAQIAQGAAMPALGEGLACEFCAARGLCRKDFWAEV
jgi:ATP-dependent helicase/nuclease subunit B